MQIRITDTTLRDGSHAMAHAYSLDHIRTIVQGLDDAGVPIIEVSHGDGLGGSSLQYGLSLVEEERCLVAAVEAATRSRIAVLLLPGIGTRVDLQRAAKIGAKVARIATHCTEADIAEQHIGLAKELGLEVITFLMMAHMTPPEDLATQALLMQQYGADVVYVVDSAGAMTPGDVRDRVRALRKALTVDVGFHAHDNLGLGVGNTLAAIEEGATNVDGSTAGLGAGAGNAKTELLAAVLDKMGIATGIDVFKILDVAEDLVRPIMTTVPTNNRATVTIGYAGVYSSFLLHTQRAATRFGVEARDILVELGKRKVVGGQEDMIVDVAVELAQRRGRVQTL